ncbi:hypothetical protein [Membranihabitans marinus]|uniref:hypothetical protein n=1 Tax=Membranihabitans marinus TaxID=1227546 RepID=UPI001F3201D5|nr:hypothetical protein [Membranihabitans marinus]
MKFKNLLGLALLVGITVVSCSDDPIITGEEVSYTADIRPLLDQKCSNPSCHGPGSVILELDTYDKVQLAAAKIRERVWVSRTMPKSGTMTEEERELVKDWVDQGAMNN